MLPNVYPVEKDHSIIALLLGLVIDECTSSQLIQENCFAEPAS